MALDQSSALYELVYADEPRKVAELQQRALAKIARVCWTTDLSERSRAQGMGHQPILKTLSYEDFIILISLWVWVR